MLYDIAVVGAGPGGYVAAIRAAQLGFKTVCIDSRDTCGGTCLNVGCIPSKALLQSTELLAKLAHEGKDMGIACSKLSADFSQMTTRKNTIVKSLTDGIDHLFHSHQITCLQGKAEFLDPHRLRIVGDSAQEIEAVHVVIATGSEPIPLPDLPFDERQIVSSTGALNFTKVPKRLLIVGGGVIGVELASVYSRLGAKVIVIEMLDHLCPAFDRDLSSTLLKILKKQGIEFFLSGKVISAVVQPDEVILTVDQNGTLANQNGDAVLVAVGRRPYTEGLQLDHIGVEKDKRGFIKVNNRFQTTQPHIFAIGDVIDGPMLAHRASAEGIAVVEALKGEHSIVDQMAIPNVVYTYPEVASVGFTEEEAKAAGLELITGKSYFRGNPRARCSSETEGFVKVIGDKTTGRLLGLHLLGPHASELIAQGVLAMQNKALVADLANLPAAHPTLSEAIKEAALAALGKPLHQ